MGVSNPVPTPPSTKKAIILPILGKKKNLVTSAATATATATAVPSPSSTPGPSSVSKENSSKVSDTDLCTTADSKMSKSEFAESSSAKKRGPGRPKKVKSSDTVITLDSDQPPELEPQVTIPPIKKRLQGNSSGNGDSKPEPSPQPHQPKANPKKTSSHSQEQGLNPGPSASSNSAPTLKPKQMSIMAFVQKKKEEALEKRVSGYLSPASEASMEEEEVKKPSVSVLQIRGRP